MLAKTDTGDWRYCGIGRESDGIWQIPSVDDATWKAWGDFSADR